MRRQLEDAPNERRYHGTRRGFNYDYDGRQTPRRSLLITTLIDLHFERATP